MTADLECYVHVIVGVYDADICFLKYFLVVPLNNVCKDCL